MYTGLIVLSIVFYQVLQLWRFLYESRIGQMLVDGIP